MEDLFLLFKKIPQCMCDARWALELSKESLCKLYNFLIAMLYTCE